MMWMLTTVYAGALYRVTPDGRMEVRGYGYNVSNGLAWSPDGKTMEVRLHVEDPGAFTTPGDAIQRYRRVEPGVADVREAFNPLSSVNDAGPMLESSCAENPNSLFGAEGTLPVPQTDKPDF